LGGPLDFGGKTEELGGTTPPRERNDNEGLKFDAENNTRLQEGENSGSTEKEGRSERV